MSTEIAHIPRQSLLAKFSSRYSVDPNKMLATLKATAFQQKDGKQITDEQMIALLVVADQYGLNPFLKEIYAYPDKGKIVPIVGVDGWARIINENPNLDGIEFKYSDETIEHKGKTCNVWIECSIRRKDRKSPITVREYFSEVVRSLNYASPWDTHPNRMHRHKTLIQCARIAFGFTGIYDEDEAERIVEGEIITQNPREAALYAALEKHGEDIEKIKHHIAFEEYKEAYDLWNAIPEEDRNDLWVAPTKYEKAPFTTEERAIIHSDEFNAIGRAVDYGIGGIDIEEDVP